MTVLEQEKLTVVNERPPEVNGARSKVKSSPLDLDLFWMRIFWGLVVLALSIGAGSLGALMNRAEKIAGAAVEQFSWLVLVQGEILEMDEVGRFLRQLPSARDVTFVSNQEAFNKLQTDPLYIGDLSAFEPGDLPSSWRVRWDPVTLDFSQLDLWLEDTKRMASVIDVAYDRNAVNTIKQFRSFWYQIQLVLSSLLVICILLSIFMLGRYLFFISPPPAKAQDILLTVAVDQIWWSSGMLFVYKIAGPIPWLVWLMGIGVGILHFIWSSLERP